MDYIKTYILELFNLTNEMSPYLLLGFLFAGLLHVFIKKETVAPFEAPSLLKDIPVGITPHEHKGRGIPSNEA